MSPRSVPPLAAGAVMLAIPWLLAVAVQAQPPDTLTLDGALARARLERPRIRAAAAATAEARAAAGLAGQIPNPLVEFTHVGSEPSEEVKAEQRLDWLVRGWADRAAGRAMVRASLVDSTLLIAELLREVRLAYFGALAAGETRRIATEQGELADSLAGFAAERVAAGEISVLERQQLELEAGRARQLASQAQEDNQVARVTLARALGDSRVVEMVLADPLDLGLDRPWPARPEGGDLPLVRRAAADSSVARALLVSAQLQRLPVPSAIIGREWESGGPFGSGSTALVGFVLPFPLWNSGGSQAARARARSRQADIAAGEARLEATRRLDEGEARLEATRARALFARDSLMVAASRLRTGLFRLYREGQTGVLPVLESLRTERDVILAEVQALLAFQRALADWLALLGRID